jgi:hypothetical protein
MLCIDRGRTAALTQEGGSVQAHQSRPADIYRANSGHKVASPAPWDRGWRHRAEIWCVLLVIQHLEGVWRTSDSFLCGGSSCSTMQGDDEVTAKSDFFSCRV